MRRLLERLLVRFEEPPTVERFPAYCAALTARYTQIGTLLFGGSALAFWPTDLWAFAQNPDATANFASSRPLNALVCLVAVALMPRFKARPIAAAVAATLTGVIVASIIGSSRARLGGLGDIWFTYSFFTPFATLILVVPFSWRVLAGVVVGGAYPMAYFGTRPEHFGHPNVPSALVFLVFITVCVVVLGHVFFRLLREQYFDRASLEERVKERTATLSRLTGRLHSLLEEERRRVAHDLHDETGALLTALRMEASALACGILDDAGRQALGRIDGIAKATLDAHRRVIQKLRPRALDEGGLTAGLVSLLDPLKERHPGLVYDGVDVGELDDTVAIAAFRIVQEAVTNALRHAHATRILVEVEMESGDQLLVRVEDDGRGFQPSSVSTGLGVVGMAERARALGGSLTVDAAPGRGTRVFARIPHEPAPGLDGALTPPADDGTRS